MLTVSQKMEAEFREMILTEKKKKQNGTSHGKQSFVDALLLGWFMNHNRVVSFGKSVGFT